MKQGLKNVAFGMIGVFLALFLWRAYVDYRDFCTMRLWVQAVQAEQMKAQQAAKPPQ